ncbi:PQ loop repeat-domain-containing protein [Phascolomyces articulosus]|uniref:PQ loop repeat-domain-containing protein n=1 Tax=Phascolomyces articulosus TaxID=60185 RepID=A0AAD5PHH6_9FUNG|nr:PQ loop repeat-domain-containing protein [Phascolomyces articulosus]
MRSQTCTPIIDGVHYIPWIHTLFGECVYGWQECISLLLGYISIACWLNAQMPQVIKNYKLQTAESLSMAFLTVWLTGDFANFIGCILTGQLDFQIYLSIYFIWVDTVLCLQWLYYVKYPNNRFRALFNPAVRAAIQKSQGQEETQRLILPRQHSQQHQTNNPSSSSSSGGTGYQSTSSSARTLLAVGFLFTLNYMSFTSGEGVSSLTTHDTTLSWDNSTSTTFMMTEETTIMERDSAEQKIWIGRFFAWVCTCLYLSSRAPQIYLNFKRRSVEGLSMALFLCAAGGNLAYTLGIFTNPHQTRQTLLEAVPYILGSAGTLMFDLTIYIQNLIYSNNTQEKNHAVDRVQA